MVKKDEKVCKLLKNGMVNEARCLYNELLSLRQSKDETEFIKLSNYSDTCLKAYNKILTLGFHNQSGFETIAKNMTINNIIIQKCEEMNNDNIVRICMDIYLVNNWF